MGRTACTEPQCLYKGDLYLYPYSNIYNPALHERAKETVDGERGKWERICFNSGWKTSRRSSADNTKSIFRLERLSAMIYSRLFQMAGAGVDPPIVSSARVVRSVPPPLPPPPPHTHVIKAGTLTQQGHIWNHKSDIQVYLGFRLLKKKLHNRVWVSN